MRLFLALLVALCAPVTTTWAQTTTQVDIHYSALALDYPDQTRSGIGASLVVSPAPWFGIDTSSSFFVSEDVGGSAWQLQTGPRVGARWNDVGIFGRMRPGFIRFSDRFYKPNIACILIFPPPESCLVPNMNFSLDIGATLEVPLRGTSHLRFDLGDTLIRYDRGAQQDAEWRHNVQFTGGVGWGF